MHQHSAFQIVFAEDNGFETMIEKNTFQNIKGFVIAPQVAHQCTVQGSTIMILNIEQDSLPGEELSSLLNGGTHIILKTEDHLRDVLELNPSHPEPDIRKAILHRLQRSAGKGMIDERIEQAMQIVRANFEQKLSSREVAQQVGLSLSRFTTLFKEQTQSSFGKFLLWTRLRRAIDLVLSHKDRSLTQAALESGFYDLPQFNKYMNEMLGVPPSILRQNSDLIQAV